MHICPDEIIAAVATITFAKPSWLWLKMKIKAWRER